MGDLRNRLKRRGAPPTPQDANRPKAHSGGPSRELIAALQQRIERVAARNAPRGPGEEPRAGPSSQAVRRADEALGGTVVETEQGSVLVVSKRFGPGYCHGRYPASAFLDAGPALAVLAGDRRLDRFSPDSALFLDLETTGLGGGTGTLPFLLGIGWLEDDGSFQVEQYFCRAPGEEPAALLLLAGRLERAGSLVTFNGRSFDWPLVNTRFVLNQMRNPGAGLPHLDLLPVARRVFKRRLRKCNLANLESAVLGIERQGDIPGHAIPDAYIAFCRTGAVEAIAKVLEHNALDLVGLAALGAVLEAMYRNPETVTHALDSLGLARAAISAGQGRAAEPHLEKAAAAESEEVRLEACCTAARSAARQGAFARARALYLQALDIRPQDPAVHLALAKHFEHREGDFDQALIHARFTAEVEGQAGMQRRLDRLERRRRNGSSVPPTRGSRTD